MKKIITFLLMIGACMSMVACGNKQEENKNASNVKTEQNKEIKSEESKTDNSSVIQSEEQSTVGGQNTTDTTDTSKTLVVYFSNTGNTKAIAEKIASGISADIFEIVPEDPYTEKDLDYGNDKSRSTIEMNNPSVRPAIADAVKNMEKYDTIYIGYPIWWGEAPRILDTFVESYDFTNKTVIPFCTSGGSGIGSSAKTLEELAGSGNWKNGEKFNGSESDEKVMKWVNAL